jgi:hypothetical protein
MLFLAPGRVARPMALKRGGFRTRSLPCQLRRSVADIRGPLLQLAGYVVWPPMCGKTVRKHGLDGEGETEDGQAVPVAILASMDTGPIGEGVFLVADGSHGLGNYDLC